MDIPECGYQSGRDYYDGLLGSLRRAYAPKADANTVASEPVSTPVETNQQAILRLRTERANLLAKQERLTLEVANAKTRFACLELIAEYQEVAAEVQELYADLTTPEPGPVLYAVGWTPFGFVYLYE